MKILCGGECSAAFQEGMHFSAITLVHTSIQFAPFFFHNCLEVHGMASEVTQNSKAHVKTVMGQVVHVGTLRRTVYE